MRNKEKIILDLCGGTGAWSRPYKEAGYDVRLITLPDYDVRTYEPPEGVYGILAAPPCTEFSVAKNGNRRKRDLALGMETVRVCLEIIWNCQLHGKLAFWAMENPRGLLRRFLGKPVTTFDPWQYGDGWTKKTDLWGYFNPPKPTVTIPPEGMTRRYSNGKSNACCWTTCNDRVPAWYTADCWKYVENICHKDFDKCDTYQKIYMDQLRAVAPFIAEDKCCVLCCHNTWYTGLTEHSGRTHCFCQLYQRELLHDYPICEYFNKLYHMGECPYFNGEYQEGVRPVIRCGKDLLSYEDKNKRDRHVSEICKGKMDTCRAYLCRQLKKFGADPQSYHTTEDLRKKYLELTTFGKEYLIFFIFE